MASNEYQRGFPLSMSFHGRSLLRRNQVISMEQVQEQELHELDLFHSHVADRLLSLLSPDSPQHSVEKPPSPLLTLPFLSKLLHTLLAVEAEFRLLLPLLGSGPHAAASRPVTDMLDRAVKSLDLCNAISLSVHSLRHAQITASALLSPRPPSRPLTSSTPAALSPSSSPPTPPPASGPSALDPSADGRRTRDSCLGACRGAVRPTSQLLEAARGAPGTWRWRCTQ